MVKKYTRKNRNLKGGSILRGNYGKAHLGFQYDISSGNIIKGDGTNYDDWSEGQWFNLSGEENECVAKNGKSVQNKPFVAKLYRSPPAHYPQNAQQQSVNRVQAKRLNLIAQIFTPRRGGGSVASIENAQPGASVQAFCEIFHAACTAGDEKGTHITRGLVFIQIKGKGHYHLNPCYRQTDFGAIITKIENQEALTEGELDILYSRLPYVEELNKLTLFEKKYREQVQAAYKETETTRTGQSHEDQLRFVTEASEGIERLVDTIDIYLRTGGTVSTALMTKDQKKAFERDSIPDDTSAQARAGKKGEGEAAREEVKNRLDIMGPVRDLIAYVRSLNDNEAYPTREQGHSRKGGEFVNVKGQAPSSGGGNYVTISKDTKKRFRRKLMQLALAMKQFVFNETEHTWPPPFLPAAADIDKIIASMKETEGFLKHNARYFTDKNLLKVVREIIDELENPTARTVGTTEGAGSKVTQEAGDAKSEDALQAQPTSTQNVDANEKLVQMVITKLALLAQKGTEAIDLKKTKKKVKKLISKITEGGLSLTNLRLYAADIIAENDETYYPDDLLRDVTDSLTRKIMKIMFKSKDAAIGIFIKRKPLRRDNGEITRVNSEATHFLDMEQFLTDTLTPLTESEMGGGSRKRRRNKTRRRKKLRKRRTIKKRRKQYKKLTIKKRHRKRHKRRTHRH